jgi:Domain of unknown function (DUF5916)/Carbohydrate family 9 binding domain-like
MNIRLACVALLAACPALAQDPLDHEMIGRAVRVSVPPVIDGRDDDAAWQKAPPMTGFRQFDPGEDLDPTFRTEVRVVYDNHFLYVLVRAYDPHPDSIVSLLSRRDVKTASDEIKIMIDGFHDQRTGFEFAVNPAGVKRDFAIYSDNSEDITWDGVWDVATLIDARGWVAEFRIPFSELRFNTKRANDFGFGVWREVARLNERDAWPVYRRSVSTLASQLGTLTGIRGIVPPRKLVLLPYAVAKNANEATATGFRSVNQGSFGLDLKAGLTSAIRLDATVNPDFGQVEADPAVLNLSPFEIRFPELRPFFREGAGLYACGGICESLFYTRRIGRAPELATLASDPAFTNITGAAKLTGRYANGAQFGVVDAVTQRMEGGLGTTIEPQTNYFVARAVRELDEGRTQFGVMLTDVRRQLDSASAASLRSSATAALAQGYTRFWHDAWRLSGYGGLTHVEGSAGALSLTQLGSVHYFQRPDGDRQFDSTRTALDGETFGLDLSKISGWLRSGTVVRWIGPGFESNDAGFVTLVNDEMGRQQFDVLQLTPGRYLRSLSGQLRYESHWTTGGLPSSRYARVSGAATLLNYWGAAASLTASDFGGVNCVSCARGGPSLRQSPKVGFNIGLIPDPTLAVLPVAGVRAGVSDEGRSMYRGFDLGGSFRVASRFSASLVVSFDHAVNDQQWIGDYGTLMSDTTHYTFARLDQNVLSMILRGNWTFTPALSFQLYAQPYVNAGTFSDWRELQAPHAAAYTDRFAAYGSGASPDGFDYTQFNLNAVLRWEYRPGSVLFVVWQQGRTDSVVNNAAFDAPSDFAGMFDTHPANTLIVKLSYWISP